MLPPEIDLMRMFGVSRATVKKTTEDMANRGLIRRRRARGTEIIRLHLREDLARLTSFTEQMAQRGLSVSTIMLEAAQRVPPAAVRARLAMSRAEKALSICRLRGTRKVFPVVLLHSHIPSRYGISFEEDFSGSLYQLLEHRYQLRITWADEEISARGASQEESDHLRISPGSTVLVMQRLTRTSGDRPLEFVQAAYRPEHYTLSIRLRR